MEAAETQEKPETGKVADRMKKQGESDEVSSPRGVLENPVSGSESDQSSTSSTSNSGSSEPPEKTASGNWPLFGENPGSQWRSLIENIKRRSARRFSMVPLLSGYDRSMKHIKRYTGRNRSADDSISCGGFLVPKPSWRIFTYEELAAATDNFSSEKLIGKGGHADVYRGRLSNGQAVAVKRTTNDDKKDEDRVSDFLTELGIIAHINHPNAARLLGYSIDGGLHLIFEFVTNGSLASVLFDSSEAPEWKIRFKVILGVAEGLNYLHSECQRRIIHRDITAANILLTEDYEPQISDFGLAKWLPEKWINHVVSPIEGTFGYMAPEYFMHGIVDEKTDVFAFGVLLLELMTGQRAVGSSQQSLVMWAKPLLEKFNMKEMADPRLGEAYDAEELKRTMLTASSCLHHLPSLRPTMSRVVQLLRGEHETLDTKQTSFGGSAVLLEACDLEGYTRKTYLKDLNRHMQLVME